jgi:hypothetical protein
MQLFSIDENIDDQQSECEETQPKENDHPPKANYFKQKEIEGKKVPAGGPGKENQPSTNEGC